MEKTKKKAPPVAESKRKLDEVRANQWIVDPRQILCWKLYINPKSKTFSNAYKSAVAAGYSKSHSLHITVEGWWQEKVRRMAMAPKAERNLEHFLDLPSEVQAMGPFGPLFKMTEEKVKLKNGKTKIRKKQGDPILVYSTGLLKVKADMTKFTLETIGKRKGYTKSLDLTSGGKPLDFKPINNDQLLKIARRISNGNTKSAK